MIKSKRFEDYVVHRLSPTRAQVDHLTLKSQRLLGYATVGEKGPAESDAAPYSEKFMQAVELIEMPMCFYGWVISHLEEDTSLLAGD